MNSRKNDMYTILTKIVHEARSGDYSNASADINRFLQYLQIELSKGNVKSDGLAKITYSLETLMEMQQKGDWVALADILEYEFSSLLKALV